MSRVYQSHKPLRTLWQTNVPAMFDNHKICYFGCRIKKTFTMIDLCFVLCSGDLDVLRTQRIIGKIQRGQKVQSHGRNQCSNRQTNKETKWNIEGGTKWTKGKTNGKENTHWNKQKRDKHEKRKAKQKQTNKQTNKQTIGKAARKTDRQTKDQGRSGGWRGLVAFYNPRQG